MSKWFKWPTDRCWRALGAALVCSCIIESLWAVISYVTDRPMHALTVPLNIWLGPLWFYLFWNFFLQQRYEPKELV